MKLYFWCYVVPGAIVTSIIAKASHFCKVFHTISHFKNLVLIRAVSWPVNNGIPLLLRICKGGSPLSAISEPTYLWLENQQTTSATVFWSLPKVFWDMGRPCVGYRRPPRSLRNISGLPINWKMLLTDLLRHITSLLLRRDLRGTSVFFLASSLYSGVISRHLIRLMTSLQVASWQTVNKEVGSGV